MEIDSTDAQRICLCGSFRFVDDMMYPSVIGVRANDDFTLHVEFDNGDEGILDMRPHLGLGVFQRIAEIDAFKTARVAFDTVQWDNGVDLDPEFVHARCRKIQRA